MLSEEVYRPGLNAETDPIAVIAHVHGTNEDAITLEFGDFQINLSVGAAESLASTIREAINGFLRHHNASVTKES